MAFVSDVGGGLLGVVPFGAGSMLGGVAGALCVPDPFAGGGGGAGEGAGDEGGAEEGGELDGAGEDGGGEEGGDGDVGAAGGDEGGASGCWLVSFTWP